MYRLLSFPKTLLTSILLSLSLLTTAQIVPDANHIVYLTPTGTGNGSSWDTPTSDFLGALNADGVQKIFVAIGNYTVGNYQNFTMKNGVEIYGGFDPANNIKTLNDARMLPSQLPSGGALGNQEGSVLDGQNIKTVVWNAGNALNNTAVLDGFTIKNGSAGGIGGRGGGIRNVGSSPTLRNLVIKNNTAYVFGGGIYNETSSPIITNCSFIGNSVTNNSGGGMCIFNGSYPTLINCNFIGNTASSSGGAIIILNNSYPTVVNCIITGNTASLEGDGIDDYSGNGTYINVTMANNGNNGFRAAGANSYWKNSIIWDNISGNSYSASYSLIKDKTTTANGNLDATGMTLTDIFTNPSGGNYTLKSGSPAIDAGFNSLFTGLDGNTKDLAGNARVYNYTTGGIIDMGAYESPYKRIMVPDANGIVYVREGYNGNGSSWEKATGYIQNAIDAQGTRQVFVASGVYRVGNRSFIMKNNVAIYGGFDPDNGIRNLSHNRIMPNPASDAGSVLDGEGTRPVIWNVFGSPQEGINNTAVLDGFTITRGAYPAGGGIRNLYASPSLNNLVIRNNTATSAGAGIHNDNSSPLVTNTVICSNTITGSNIFGAGIYNINTSAPVLTNVTIAGNILTAPIGPSKGAGVYSYNSSPKIYNSIIWNNRKMSTPFTPGADIESELGTVTLKNSITQVYSTGNNQDSNKVSENPLFVDESTGDYTLMSTSPAINAGNNSYYTGLNATTKDLAGNPRTSSVAIDIGAYEYQLSITPDTNKIVYVKQAGTGKQDGSSWENATSDLQGAINANGTEKVLVATGNYNVSSTSSFVMKNGVAIYGGFNPISNTTDWNTRTLSSGGAGEGSVLNGQNSRPVIWNDNNGLTPTALLDGFTIANGKSQGNGGGIYNRLVSPTFANLVIKNNEALEAGGGICNSRSGATFSNTIIKNNTALYGGGIYNNSAPSVFTNVSITGNSATMSTTGAGGGGIFNENSALILTNVLITGNSTNFQGGGIRNLSDTPVLTNVTIAGNTAGVTGYDAMDIQAGRPQINNSVVYGTISGNYTPEYSLVEGNTGSGNGNINAAGIAPADIFNNPSAGDYTLKNGAPAINTASNALFPGLDAHTRDLAGNPRVYDFGNGGNIDMGAYESSFIPSATSTPDTNGILYVNKNNNGGNQSGDSWLNAVAELADALEAARANTSVKEIYVAKGTYLPMYAPVATDTAGNTSTDQDKTFLLVKDVKIYGGFDPENGKSDMLTRDPKQAVTILSGDIGATDIPTDNTYHVVLSVGDAGTALLDGFTISNGYAFGNNTPLNINSVNIPRYAGAGLYLVESNPVIRQVTVSSNMAMVAGAGMYLASSTASITNVRISANITYGDGGGMFNANASPILTNVLIDNNSAGSLGGGGMVNAISNPVLTNVTITGNTQGGLLYHSGSIPLVRNSIIYGNTAYNVWNRNAGSVNADFNHSLVQGSGGSAAWNTTIGTDNGSNIDVDPVFVDTAGRNYRLQQGSEALDAGDNALFYMGSTPDLSAITTDIDGNPRISEGTIDLGAYELMLTPPVIITPDSNNIAYVRPVATGTGNGRSWEDATADLNGAIHSGATRVFVAAGNYNVPPALLGFTMKNGVKIYGGFDPDNNIRVLTDPRILPNKLPSFGGIGGAGSILNGRNIKSVIRNEFTTSAPLDTTALLDGFTIQNGNATDGGGIYNRYAAPTLANLVIRNNTASGRGGGIFNWEASPVLNDIVVINNTAADNGGGIYTGNGNDLKMTRVLIKGNTANNGGGIYHFDTRSSLSNVAIIGNSATGTATGSAFHAYSGTNHLVNITIAGNSGNALYNGATAFLDNSIIYGGTDGLVYTAQYSLIEGNTNISNGNLNPAGTTANDIFENDYSLKSTSAAVNAGSNQLYWNAAGDGTLLPAPGATVWGVDLAGNPRVFGEKIDLGAYELQTPPVIIITPDTNGIAYVRPVATGTGRGSDWENATADLQGAINSGATEVFVAKGAYTVPASGSFTMKDNVQIYGGFDPENNIKTRNDTRILPNQFFHSPGGSAQGSVLNGQNQHSVITNTSLSSTAVLDGFTITGGKDEVTGGGGIANTFASPVLRNLVISDNSAVWDGGGIYNFNSSPILTNVVLTRNTAISGWGGALSNWDNSNPILVNVLINDNSTSELGGAIYNSGSSPQLTNVTIAGNDALDGGGIYNDFGSSPQVANSIIYGNTGQNIVNADTTADIPVFSFSLVQGSGGSNAWERATGADGGNNIDTIPLFTDAGNGDYTLKPGAPATNAGKNALFAGLDNNSKDLAGKPRVYNGTTGGLIDLGAYELQCATIYVTDTRTECAPYTWIDGIQYTSDNNAATFTIPASSGCDSVITLHLTIRRGTHNTENQTACDSFVWNAATYTTSGTYTHDYTNANGCSSTDTLHLTINKSTHNTENQTACDSFVWNAVTYTTSGVYTYNYTNVNGCPSTDTLHLTINKSTHNTENETACDSFVWKTVTYTTSGTYTYNYTNANGCPSTDTLHLTVNKSTHNTANEIACDSFLWNGTTYTISGVYTYNYTNANGCPSTDTLHLTINKSTHNIENQIACDSFLWNGTIYTTSGVYTYNYTNANGCPSTDTLHLTINKGTHNTESQTACESYVWKGTTYTTSGIYTYDYTNANGCPSTDTLHLTVNKGNHNTESYTTCESFLWNTATYTTSGTYTYSYTNANGCPSTDTLHLTINKGMHNTEYRTACDSFVWNGATYTTSGIYIYTNTNSCPGTDTLYLTINKGTHNAESQKSCNSFVWNGTTYTEGGTYTYNYANANGCPSTDTLHLTINNGTHNTENQMACESYLWNSTTYTTSGVYTYNYTDINGCSSTDTLHLTVNYGTYNSEIQTVSDSFVWYGTTYTKSGIYTYDYTNAYGCPSTDTLHLTIQGGALPVRLLSFTAEKQGYTALLQWTTASEQNNKGFDIEHSTDAKNWSPIAFLHSLAKDGNSSGLLNYTYTHNKPVQGKNFYRLKQTDYQGSYEYSPVRMVNLEDGKEISIYPNPANEQVTLTGLKGNETIVIYDIPGRKLKQVKSNNTDMTISLANLNAGVYQVHIISAGGTVATFKLVKVN